MAVLKNMLTFALDKEYIDSHPLVRFSLLPEPEKALTVMTISEERRLVECVGEFDIAIGAYTALLGETGMRKSEGLRLRWKDLDFSNRLVSLGETKSGYARYVPLTEFAITWLKRLTRVVGEPHVFLRSNRKPWRDPREPFDKGRKEARLQWVGFHDLRHFRATQWVKHGVDLRTVQHFLGHADISTTMRYAHFAPDHAVRSVNKVEVMEMQELESERDDSGTTLVSV